MSANPKTCLTKTQIIAALRKILAEKDENSRNKMARELGETNAPDLIKNALKSHGLTLSSFSGESN